MYINIFYLYTYSMRASRISLKRNFSHNGFEQHPKHLFWFREGGRGVVCWRGEHWPIEHPSEGKENTDHEFSLVPKERG